ncbi:hypothetical protein B0H13DRAFT_2318835 [Mycena leptocephala]|nr:hypothetical protein B0H13DRAFT_2318835 [Mycena leptocephala]
MRTIDGVVYATYQEAARAMLLFDNRDEGLMAFEEMLDFGTTPAQLHWTFVVLAVEGNPALAIWEAHEKSVSADIRDRMLRTTASPNTDMIKNEVLLLSFIPAGGKSIGGHQWTPLAAGLRCSAMARYEPTLVSGDLRRTSSAFTPFCSSEASLRALASTGFH